MKYRKIAVALAAVMTVGCLFYRMPAVSSEISEEEAEPMEQLEEAPDDSDGALTEEAAAETTKGSDKKEKDKDKGGDDLDGLIEDTGKVTSVHNGSTLEEIQEKEEANGGWVNFPGFEVDPWKYPPVNITKNTQAIYWYLREELELNHAAACGVLANIQLEANFKPIALGDGGTSYGICQWHLGRFSRLMDYCRHEELDYNTLEGQLSYLGYELKNYYPHVLEGLLEVADTAKGAYAAGYLFCYQFEMPDQIYNRSRQRGNLAQFEYYPQEIEEPDEEELKAIMKEIPEEDDEEADGSEGKLPGIVLPENYQLTLLEYSEMPGELPGEKTGEPAEETSEEIAEEAAEEAAE